MITYVETIIGCSSRRHVELSERTITVATRMHAFEYMLGTRTLESEKLLGAITPCRLQSSDNLTQQGAETLHTELCTKWVSKYFFYALAESNPASARTMPLRGSDSLPLNLRAQDHVLHQCAK
eukprot:1024834-Amphidinium_carterae.2